MSDLPATMKAVVFHGPKHIAVEDRPVPKRKSPRVSSIISQHEANLACSARSQGHHCQSPVDSALRLVCSLSLKFDLMSI
jgi:hypothetical protein